MVNRVYKILLFGTGRNAERTLHLLRKEHINIVGAIDNNCMKHNGMFHDLRIYSPNDISGLSYDYIIITSVDYKRIWAQLESYQINMNRVFCVFAFDHSKYDAIGQVLVIEELDLWEMELQVQKLQHRVNNMQFEFYDLMKKENPKIPIIMDSDSTIKQIVCNRKSLSRFGEGEFRIIFGDNLGFQKTEDGLASRLQQILKSDCENILIGLPDMYGAFHNRTQFFVDYFREFLDNGEREREYELFDFDKTYYDSFLTRPYIDYQDKSQAKERFLNLKQIWEQKDVVVVEGNRTFLGIGNDLLSNTKSCQRIECPNTDAFCYYEEILRAVYKVSKEKLILIALGPTASVLAYDLACKGYQAIDIGHIDIEYEWYLMGATTKVVVNGKYTNEVAGGNDIRLVFQVPEESIIECIGE